MTIIVYLAILASACGQWVLGGAADGNGEQAGLALPFSALVLAGGALVLLFQRRRSLPPPCLSWPQAALLALMCLGLLGTETADLAEAVRQLLRLAEIFLVAWYVFFIIRDDELRSLVAGIGVLCVVLTLLGIRALYTAPGIELSDAKYASLVVVSFPFLLLSLKSRSAVVRWLTLSAVCVLVAAGFRNAGLLLVFVVVFLFAAAALNRRWLAGAFALSVLTIGLSVVWPSQETSAWDTLNPRFSPAHEKRLFIEYSAALLAPAHYPLGGGLWQYKRTINVLRQFQTEEPDPAENRVPENSNSQYLLTLVEAGTPAALGLLICLAAMVCFVLRGSAVLPPDERDFRFTLAAALIGALLAGLFCAILSRGIGIWLGALLGLASRYGIPSAPIGWRPRLLLPGAALLVSLALMLTLNGETDRIEHLSAMNRQARTILGLAEADSAASESGKNLSEGGLEIVALAPDTKAPEHAIHVEAENYAKAEGQFRKIPANDSSGNWVLEIPKGAGKGVGRADYSVQVESPGTYVLVARVWWEDGCSNSLGFTLNGKDAMVASELFCRWHLLQCRQTFELPAGPLTVIVRNLEDGVRLDYFELRQRGTDSAER